MLYGCWYPDLHRSACYALDNAVGLGRERAGARAMRAVQVVSTTI